MKAFLAIISHTSGIFKLTDNFETDDMLSIFWNILLKILKTLSWSNALLAFYRWENQGVESLLEVTQLVGCNWDLSSPLAGLGSSGWRRWHSSWAFPQGGRLGGVWGSSTLSVTKKGCHSHWQSSSQHATASVVKAESASLTSFRPPSLAGPDSLHPALCSVDIWSYFFFF